MDSFVKRNWITILAVLLLDRALVTDLAIRTNASRQPSPIHAIVATVHVWFFNLPKMRAASKEVADLLRDYGGKTAEELKAQKK